MTTASGTAFALAAYGLWGLMPAYWKQLASIPVPELTAWRALCSAAFGFVAVALSIFTLDALRTTREPSTAQPTP